MPEIKWIKLATDIFDDDKIRLIEAMPDADTLLVIWVKLLCQAGKINASGYIFLSRDIPFSDNDLATLFNRPLNTIRFALATFQRFGMIEVDNDGIILLPKWEKHQNVIALENIKEQARIRQQKRRLLLKESSTENNNVTSRDSHTDVTHQNKKEERRIRKKNKNIYIDLPDFIDKDLWNDFLLMRKAIKKPAAQKAQELIIAKLESLKSTGDEPNEVLRRSIISSWAGVFPLNGGGNGKNRSDIKTDTGKPTYTPSPDYRD